MILCLSLFLQCGEAQVKTVAQTGPLYRVVGSRLSISCNVSGFRNENSTKHFNFYIKKPANPTFEINIISTETSDFSYAIYQKRVWSKDILITRVSPNSVIFVIQSLQKGDEGEYDCGVVNTERGFAGDYSANTTVKVIDNSLSVSSPASALPSFNEGEDLVLTCQASSNTIQHTHLSFAWYLHKDGENNSQPIISLNRDFTLSTGQGFEGRYQAGLLSLDKLGEATYRLKMSQLEPSDQGKIHCQAQEWIQDPDHSWYPIAQSDAEEMTLEVKAREVKPDTLSLVVRILAQQTTIQEGKDLALSCNIDTLNLEGRFFSVAFLRDSVELARIGPTGVLSVGPEYRGREKEGELRATRTGNRDYRLILQPVRTEDQGEYKCRVWPQERGHDGVFTQGASQDSSSQHVSISTTESGLSVKMQGAGSVAEGGRLRLACEVEGVKGQLSVTWQYKSSSTPAALLTNVISLSQEGVIEETQEFRSRKARATRPAANIFIFELDEVKPSDSGAYQCAVSEWKSNSKTYSQTQAATVNVTPLDMKVVLISRDNQATVWDNVQMMCRIRGPDIPITLTWSLQRDASTLDNILTVYSNGTISWSFYQHHYQVKVEKKNDHVIHYLQIIGASHREAGKYQCRVSVFLDNVHKKLPPSNLLAVEVRNPESNLSLSSPPTMTTNINTDINIVCSIVSKVSASSLYAVTWLLEQEGNNKTIVSSDRNGVVTYAPHFEVNQRKRISMIRTNGGDFELTVRQATTADRGTYQCVVEEWVQDPRGDWYQLSTVLQASRLNVVEPANDFFLDKTEQKLIAKEGAEVELKCDIVSPVSGASFFYKVSWLHTVRGSPTRNASLVELDHTGLLSYPTDQGVRSLQQRLHLSRPTQSSFSLRIQKVREVDSGTYWCRVEQYQLDHDNRWLQKASESVGPITLTVNVAEQNLLLEKQEEELNVSLSQDFTIPCHIASQSSNESKFQVTWFWQKETKSEQRSIFTVHRNSTLQDSFGKGINLRFVHPLPNQYSITVLNPCPENSGLYFCEVEEWLPSLSRGWRKVAVDRSGQLTVNINSKGHAEAVSESACNPVVWIVVIVCVLIVLMSVIVLLMVKICRSKSSEGKKTGQSFWAEQHPLKPTADD